MFSTAQVPTSLAASLAVVEGPGLVDNGRVGPILCVAVGNAAIHTDAASLNADGGVYIGYAAASFWTGSLPVRSTRVAGQASVEQLITA